MRKPLFPCDRLLSSPLNPIVHVKDDQLYWLWGVVTTIPQSVATPSRCLLLAASTLRKRHQLARSYQLAQIIRAVKNAR